MDTQRLSAIDEIEMVTVMVPRPWTSDAYVSGKLVCFLHREPKGLKRANVARRVRFSCAQNARLLKSAESLLAKIMSTATGVERTKKIVISLDTRLRRRSESEPVYLGLHNCCMAQ